MSEFSRPWTADDVPAGPYFHGSRHQYAIGDQLHTDIISNQPHRPDNRQMCFATIDEDAALQWAYQRSRKRGPVMFVYEVDLVNPMVDVNAHNDCCWVLADVKVNSVMAEEGIVTKLVRTMHEDEWPGPRLF